MLITKNLFIRSEIQKQSENFYQNKISNYNGEIISIMIKILNEVIWRKSQDIL